MHYKKRSQMFICSLQIVVTLGVFMDCKAQIENRVSKYFGYASNLQKYYCDSTCGQPRFGLVNVLENYCKLRCPDSPLANLPSSNSQNTTSPPTSPPATSNTTPTVPPGNALPAPTAASTNSPSGTTASPGSSNSAAATPQPPGQPNAPAAAGTAGAPAPPAAGTAGAPAPPAAPSG